MDLELANKTDKMYSSLYLVEQINTFRKAEGNGSELKHSDFLKKIRLEFDEEIREGKISLSQYEQKMPTGGVKLAKKYELNFTQSVQMLMSESKSVRKAVLNVIEKQAERIKELEGELAQFKEIEPHTKRPIQIDNAKGANSFAFTNGKGKEDAIDWNRKVSLHFTKMTPSELKEWAKKNKVPYKNRTSGKEVIRQFRPDKAAGVSIADWLHSKGATDEEALTTGQQAIPVINTLLKYKQLN